MKTPPFDTSTLAALPPRLRDVDLAEFYGVHRATIWRWVERGLLPRPVKLSPQTTRFRRDDIVALERDQLGEGV